MRPCLSGSFSILGFFVRRLYITKKVLEILLQEQPIAVHWVSFRWNFARFRPLSKSRWGYAAEGDVFEDEGFALAIDGFSIGRTSKDLTVIAFPAGRITSRNG